MIQKDFFKSEYSKQVQFAVAKLLRELGFHKESPYYFVATGNDIVLCKIRFDAEWFSKYGHRQMRWHTKHDWNGFSRYTYNMLSSMMDCENMPQSGYLCTMPDKVQAMQFMDRLGIDVEGTETALGILAKLLAYYRTSRHDGTAFRKFDKLLEAYGRTETE